ncbi:MAG: hypothetical protein IGS48_15420 [Oscillatoriales cyanobacterium C42_A2020_001]|nr:hypothetical protein [Leptolyngbyaceae cyanobacterium C42_A2020_001]
MNFKLNQKAMNSLVGAIAASAFLGVAAVIPQAAFSQTQSPGASGDVKVDEGANAPAGTRVDDPSRPMTNQNDSSAPANSAPAQRSDRYDRDGSTTPGVRSQQQPENRVEKYTQPDGSKPNTTNRSGENPSSYTTPGSRGTDRLTSPSQNTPGRGTYTSPRSQVNDNSTGVGGGAGGTGADSQINNSTSPNTNAQPDNRIERYTQPGSTTPNSTTPNSTTTPNSGTGVDGTGDSTGGGTGGSGSVPGLW